MIYVSQIALLVITYGASSFSLLMQLFPVFPFCLPPLFESFLTQADPQGVLGLTDMHVLFMLAGNLHNKARYE